MANAAKNAILRAKLNGVLTELLVRTNADNVIIDEQGSTLAAHLGTLASAASVEQLQQAVNALGALASKNLVSQSDLDEALAALITGKANQSDLDALSDTVDELAAAGNQLNEAVIVHNTTINTLVGEDTGKSVREIANEELAAQLIGESAKESLDTLEEIAKWIQDHPDDAAAMNAAIEALQAKVDTGDQTVSAYVAAAIAALNIGDYATAANLAELADRVSTAEGKISGLEESFAGLGALASKDKVSQSDLDDTFIQNMSDLNGAVVANTERTTTLVGEDAGKSARTIAEEVLEDANLGNMAQKNQVSESDLDAALRQKVNDISEANHSHLNEDVLNGITEEKVVAWDAKTTVFYAAEEPAAMAEGDLWFQIF